VSNQPRAASGATVRTKHRRHLGVGDSGRTFAVVDDAAGEPESFIGEGDEMLAVRAHPKRRKAAEMAIVRGQFEAAAEFQRAEAALFLIARQEQIDGLRVHLDRDRAIVEDGLRDRPHRKHQRRKHQRRRHGGDRGDDAQGRAAGRRAGLATQGAGHECSRRAGRRTGSAGGASSNSSASFSIMTPPSSSASTIVTARR